MWSNNATYHLHKQTTKNERTNKTNKKDDNEETLYQRINLYERFNPNKLADGSVKVWVQIKGSSLKASPQKDNSAAQKLQT